MSNLARWFNANGFTVSGYDRTPSPLTAELQTEGIQVHYDDNLASIKPEVLNQKAQTLIVLTPAVPATLGILQFFMQNNFQIHKRAEVLGFITNAMRSIGVAGTHGKTTTSSMCAYLLHAAGLDSAAFLGGIAVNFNSNLLLNRQTTPQTPAVVEADEFDRSFLHLQPSIAIITSTDADHLDIYQQKSALEDSFVQYALQCRPEGSLIVAASIDEAVRQKIEQKRSLITYSAQSTANADIKAEQIRVENGCFVFNYVASKYKIDGLLLQMPGQHNVENALAAITVALELGIEPEKIKQILPDYKGVKRRFEIHIKTNACAYIDDYAHHPTEIQAFLTGLKTLYPQRPITAIFQPHLFSRTNDFKEDFAKSLEIADHVFLMDIYPARELPMEGVTVATIKALMREKNVQYVQNQDLLATLRQHPLGVWATVGAGDIDRFVIPIKELLEERMQYEKR